VQTRAWLEEARRQAEPNRGEQQQHFARKEKHFGKTKMSVERVGVIVMQLSKPTT
jgi:hypothetical protein